MPLNTNFDDFALHIAFCTYPHVEKDSFLESIKKVYEEYKIHFHKYTGEVIEDPLFSPKTYHVYGHWDTLILAPVTSYKFAQRVFNHDDFQLNSPISYQIQIGSSINFDTPKLIDNFTNFNKKFILHSNLKLDNGLLIGNGEIFQEGVSKKIHSIIKRVNEKNPDCISIFSIKHI
jgi:hypothetical protein